MSIDIISWFPGEILSQASLSIAASLFTLTLLEIVLGIDNLIFLALLTNKLPEQQRLKAQKVGLIFAMLSRLLLLFVLNFISNTELNLFTVNGFQVTLRSLVIGLGGMFLFYKAIHEIHNDLESEESKNSKRSNMKSYARFWSVILQVMIIDIVFSLDSVITAVGMSNNYYVMSIAIVISVILMLFASDPLSRLIAKHPTIKMLALSFLILVGTMLMAESIGYHVEKGYLYFAIAFSLLVEGLNIYSAKKKNKI